MLLLALGGLLFLSLSLPANAATFLIQAPQMRVSRQERVVRLEFPRGIRATSDDGYFLRAGGAVVLLSNRGFQSLEDGAKGDSEGKLPELPQVRLSSRGITLVRLSGNPVLSSSDYQVSADTMSSRDGGDTWALTGSVRFARNNGDGQGISSEGFVFDRLQNTLTTKAPISVAGFATEGAEASLSAGRILIDLEERKISLLGNASFSLGDYRLEAEEMWVDIERTKLSAPRGGYFRLGQSEVHAEHVVVAFQEGEATLDASGLSGRVYLEDAE